jgi:hypothetical protein
MRGNLKTNARCQIKRGGDGGGIGSLWSQDSGVDCWAASRYEEVHIQSLSFLSLFLLLFFRLVAPAGVQCWLWMYGSTPFISISTT